MKWSKSAAQCFRRCQRQWYYRHQLANAPEYPAFYPATVLDEIVGTAFGGFQAAGIRCYRDTPTNSVARVLNQAWIRFWSAPADFVDWEQRAVQSLLRSEGMLNDA